MFKRVGPTIHILCGDHLIKSFQTLTKVDSKILHSYSAVFYADYIKIHEFP